MREGLLILAPHCDPKSPVEKNKMDRLKVKLKCPKLLSSTGHRSIIRAPAKVEAAPERKDLLPWPIRTRKRGSSSLALVSVESKDVSASASESINPPPPPPPPSPSRSWSFTDLPPKKRILLAVRARRVDQTFMCVTCGRVFEDYHALGGHKSQHRKRLEAAASDQTHHRRVDDKINAQPKETLALPWYDAAATAKPKEITRFKVKM